MPDILTQPPSRQPPALNATSDMPVIDAKPAAPAPAPAAATPTPAPAPAPAAAVTTDGTTTSATATPDPDQAEEAAVTRKPWFQKRIDELTRQRHEAERKFQAETEARQRLEQELATRTKPPEVKPEDDPEPAKADFEDPDAYTDARARWAARQEFRQQQKTANEEIEKRRAAEREASAKTAIETLHKQHNERVEKAKAELPDFEKVALRDDLQVRYDVFFAIEKSPMGPYLMYHLGKNPEVAKELNALEPIDVVRKLVEIESTIKAERSRTVTKAADPIEPLKSAGGTSNPKSPEDMTMEEYDAWLTPQLNAARRPSAPRRRT